MPTTSIMVEFVDSSKIYKANYQRETSAGRVKRIAETWKEDVANFPKVSYRDGKYWVFDGAHTLAARKLRNGNKDLLVECKVYRGLTYNEEAELFVLQNGISKGVEANAKLKALYEKGDVDVREFKKEMEDLGIIIDFSKSSGFNKIVCVNTAFKLYSSRSSSRVFKKAIELIKYSWGGMPSSFQKEVIIGMDMFVDTYSGMFKENALTSALSKYNPETIKAAAKSIPGNRCNAKYATQILRFYNEGKGKGKKSLDESLLWK